MWSLLRRSRTLPRIRRIATVLARHGLGWLADQAGLSRFLDWPRRLFRRGIPSRPFPTLAQHLCQALQELGPTFILLGRYLSTRLDLLPLGLCRELACLPSHGPAIPADEVVRILQEELGRPIAESFPEFDPTPCRCTWLKQTHLARTPAGQALWVTVLNEPVRSRLEQDRPVLQELARLIERHAPRERGWSARAIVQQFEATLRQEFDLPEQGHNAERWQHDFPARHRPAGRQEEAVAPDRCPVEPPVFPEIDWERSTAHVLVCQALPGRPLVEVAASPAGQGDELARALYCFFGQAALKLGLYPTPPALDGLVVLEDGRLAVTALAPTGYLDSSVRLNLLRLLEHFQAERIGEIVETGAALGMVEQREASTAVYQAVRHLIDRFRDLPPAGLRLAELAEDLFALPGRNVIVLPEELSLLLRTLVAVEDLGRRLAPQGTAAQELAPVVQRAIAEQHSWKSRQGRLLRAGQAGLEALQSLPADLKHLLSQAVQGDLLVGVEPRGWQKPMHRLERMLHRLVLSVIAAGLLIALTLLATTLLPASWGLWGWIMAGLAMFALLGMGVLLLFSFLRRE